MLGAVELLRIESLPPPAFAIGGGQIAIVGRARARTGFVGAVGGLEPPPVASLMHRNAETQSLSARGLGPNADNIAMRPDILSIPRMMLGTPGVKTIVMVGQGNKQSGARPLVALN